MSDYRQYLSEESKQQLSNMEPEQLLKAINAERHNGNVIVFAQGALAELQRRGIEVEIVSRDEAGQAVYQIK
jgi:hypothetical protein